VSERGCFATIVYTSIWYICMYICMYMYYNIVVLGSIVGRPSRKQVGAEASDLQLIYMTEKNFIKCFNISHILEQQPIVGFSLA
jgi:hypothetical protein